MPKERHIVFIDELRRHADREVCLGAAAYASERRGWAFDPWPVRFRPGATIARELRLVSGILTTDGALPQPPAIRRLRIPVVYCLGGRAHARDDVVSIDEVAVGQMAAHHLWERGYRHFAFIGSSSFPWSRGRARGFHDWLAAAGRRPANHLFSAEQLPVFWSWNLARRGRYLQQVLTRLPRPCGIFAANDVIACFVLQAARHGPWRVPEDFGVVGVDNDPFPNAAAGLAISSIELPFREVGRQAAQLLQERWQGAAAGRVQRLPPVRVAVRASTDAFMTGVPLVRKAQAYVELHRQRRVTVGELTRALGTNRVTLGKYFQQELDTTLQHYLLRRRMARATELLRQGNANVDEVALACGLSSTSYFSRVFQRLTGQRPGAVRRGRHRPA